MSHVLHVLPPLAFALVGLAFAFDFRGLSSNAVRRSAWNRGGSDEAWILGELDVLERLTGHFPRATDLLGQALTIFREIDDHYGEAWTLGELGVLQRLTGNYPQATDLLEQALTIFREIGDRNGETEVLNHHGDLLRSSGEYEESHARHREALQTARQLGILPEEARAMAGIGRCVIFRNDVDGVSYMRRAVEIFQRLGAAETAELETELDALAGSGYQLPADDGEDIIRRLASSFSANDPTEGVA